MQLFSALRPDSGWMALHLALCRMSDFRTRETTVQLKKSDKIFVAGHRGMVGSAFVRRLQAEGFTNLLMAIDRTLDLDDESAVAQVLSDAKTNDSDSRGGEGRRDKGKQ